MRRQTGTDRIFAMYIPAPFRQDDLAELHALVSRYSFATLVTQHDGSPFATHLPVLLDSARGPCGTLRAHLARANPQCEDLADGQEALVIFQGPHAYVSPSSYETHPSVPTWDYAVVHAYGVPRIVDAEALYGILSDLVAKYESGRANPWSFDLPRDYLQGMMRGIVGFEIEVARLEGKYKLSQNRSDTDRDGVAIALRDTGSREANVVAEWVERARSDGTP